MAEAETSDARLVYSRESTFGTNPGTGAKYVRITSEAFKENQGRVKSEEVTGSRNPRENIRTSVDAGGDVNFEFSENNFDDLLEDTMMADFPSAPTLIEVDVAFVGATQKITAASGLGGISKGQWFRVSGATNPTNNGIFRAAVASIATEITAETGSGIVNEVSASGRKIQPSMMLRPGTTLHSATYEKQFTDVSQFQQFNGQVVESLSISASREQVITGSATFMGKNAAAMAGTTAMGTIAAAGTESIASSVDSLRGVREGSLAADTDLRLTELTLTINNATRLKRGASDLTPFNVGLGILDVEAAVQFYLADDALIDKYQANTTTPFSFRIEGAAAASPDYVFTLTKARINDADDPITGNSDDVYINATLSAETDADGVAFQIDKIPAIV